MDGVDLYVVVSGDLLLYGIGFILIWLFGYDNVIVLLYVFVVMLVCVWMGWNVYDIEVISLVIV